MKEISKTKHGGPRKGQGSNRKGDVSLMKGQVALETLVVVGFLFLFLIPLVVYVSQIFSSEAWKLDSQQASAAVGRIVGVANKLSIGGEGSSSTENIFLPTSAEELVVSNKSVTVKIDAKALGIIDQTAIADVEIQLNPASNWTDIGGFNLISLNYTAGKVLITKRSR